MACPPNCKFCIPVNGGNNMTLNEKQRLEVVIEQKDRALAEANKRVDIFREAMLEAGRQAANIEEENRRLNRRVAEQNEWLIRHTEEIRLLKSELATEKDNHKKLADMYANLQRHVTKILERLNAAKNILYPSFE